MDGLGIELGDPRAPAQMIRSAATEDSLWAQLDANLPEIPHG